MSLIIQDARPAPLWRHLAAMLYDSFLLAALWLSVGFVFIFLNHGEPVRHGYLHYLLQLTMLLVWGVFFTYFWSQQGQTLGMRAWRLMVTDDSGKPLSAKQAAWRWLSALVTCLPCGFGLWWRFLDRERRTLYDRWSATRLYSLPSNPYPSSKRKNRCLKK